MRGIQINNFFNNHISLNGKKINNNNPTNVYQPSRPQPLIINHLPKNEDPEEIIISNAVTPQMKSKQISNSARKNRSNTIAPAVENKKARKSKQKFSVSQQQIRRPFSAQKYCQHDTSQQKSYSKPSNTSYKKLKPSLSKIQKELNGVKRSKSAIIKRSKPLQINQISKQIVRQSKKSMIYSIDTSMKKNPSKKLIKKQTQILIKQKQKTERGQCRTARVQSHMVKPRKVNEKISSDFKSIQNGHIDLRIGKFQTQKKSARTAATKSYLTSAKQSKPISARQRKLKKKLFNNSKQKQHIKIQDRYNNNQQQQYITSGQQQDTSQDNQQVNQAIHQLQSALQNINSKKALAKELKKFTHKLKQIADNDNQGRGLEDNQQGEDEEIQEFVEFNNEAFRKIKHFGVEKRSKEAVKKEDRIGKELERQQMGKSKNSSKKLINKKKKLQQLVEPSTSTRNINQISNSFKQTSKKFKNIEIKSTKKQQKDSKKHSPIKNIDEPSPFLNQQSDQSRYIQSRNNSAQKYSYQNDYLNNASNSDSVTQSQNKNHIKSPIQQQQVLDENNKKYMQFLKHIEAENNCKRQKNQLNCEQQIESEQYHSVNNQNPIQSYNAEQQQQNQQSQNLIDDINNYLNNGKTTKKVPVQSARLYDSQKNQHVSSSSVGQKIFNNPMLQRRRIQTNDDNENNFNRKNKNLLMQNVQKNVKEHSLSDQQKQDQEQQCDQEQAEINRLVEIEKLKQFQKQSDKMMQKIGVNGNSKGQNKKKNLTLQLNLNSNNNKPQNQVKNPFFTTIPKSLSSSPKYDDRYPHLIKSPKLSDIQITNILSIKQKCLSSKHQKMNQLIQKMFQKQLVSPKSYEYSMYQLKKKFQQQSDGLDGFKEQASQILKEINKDKDDIKGIDQLIREERWQEARNLMKMDHTTASVFSGFKKNKDNKISQEYEGWEKVQVNKQQSRQTSPNKRPNIQVITNNISISIKPSSQQIRKQIPQSFRGNNKNSSQQFRQKLIRQDRLVNAGLTSSDSSQSNLQHNQKHQDSIARKLQFQFEKKYQLKSNQSCQNQKNYYSQDLRNLQQQVSDYLNVQKADSQDFEHYVYYQSQDNQNNESITEENNSNVSNASQRRSKQLKQQGIFKLIEVQTDKDVKNKQQLDEQDDESQNDLLKLQQIENNIKSFQKPLSQQKLTQKRVIQIYNQQQDALQSQQSLSRNQNLIRIPNIQNNNKSLPKISSIVNKFSENQVQDQQEQDSDNSLIQLQVRKGFQSNLFFIKQYCISLCQYIRDSQQRKLQFKQYISEPIKFNTIELLKKYRQKLNGEYDNRYNSSITELEYKRMFRKPVKKAISEELADQFNKSYGQLKFYNVDLDRKGREKFAMEKQAERKFLSSILEVLNESLDFQRPGSIFGKPLPWANNSKYLKNMKYLNSDKKKKISSDAQQSAQTYDFIFGVAIARIIQWGSCLCGFLPDTAQLQNTQIDQDYVVHIRQTRMAFLLQKMLAQQQATINNSQLQQTEIMLCLGKEIMDELAREAEEEIRQIFLMDYENNSFNKNSNAEC